MGATTSCAAGAQRMHYLIASLPIALYALALILGLFNVDLPFASPFQLEIGAANLAIGLGAIAATILGLAAAWAIFFVAASFLWGAAAVHISDMVRNGNFAINIAGPIFWWNILTPLTLLIALL